MRIASIAYNWLPAANTDISGGSDPLLSSSSNQAFALAANAFASIQQEAVANIGSLVAGQASARLRLEAMAHLFDKKV